MRTIPSATHTPVEPDLPKGWVLPALGEILSVKYGKGLPEKQRTTGPVPVYGSNGVIGYHSVSLTAGPTIILGRKGTVGAVHYSKEPCWPIDTTYFVEHFNEIDPLYLYYGLQTLNLKALDTSTSIPGLNRDDLYDQRLPLAPLLEQKRIVEKVEALLARVSAARERLAKVPEHFKRFRQAVLAAACSGRLSEDYRNGSSASDSAQDLLEGILARRRVLLKENADTYKDPMQPDPACVPEKPEQWVLASVDQLTCLVTSGSRGWAKYYSPSGSLFIRAQDINTDKLNLNNVVHVQLPSRAEGKRTRVELGDVLVTITGANVTKSALVKTDLQEAYVSQHVALVRPVDRSIAEYLYLWLVSPVHGHAKMLNDAYGAGKPGLNLDNIREITVALPPLSEQKQLLRYVDALFTLAERVEARYNAGLRQIELLTSTLLASAFHGDLVPQDPTDEPASVLLDRIRAKGAIADASNVALLRDSVVLESHYESKAEVIMIERKDVQPSHLSSILKIRGPLSAEALWSASQLEIDDFYDQLKDEEVRGLLKETRPNDPKGERLLEAA